MAAERIETRTPPTLMTNQFYRRYYALIIMGVMGLLVILMAMMGFVFYQISTQPLPAFYAINPKNERMELSPAIVPNLLPDTIIRFASKAATLAYTFDFSNYNQQILLAKPYFTEAGWADYNASVSNLVETIVQNQLFVSGVVAGTPVISNQGELPALGYTWKVQIPFLVTYQSANTTSTGKFLVVITLVKVSTTINPQGIGIEQFVMVPSS